MMKTYAVCKYIDRLREEDILISSNVDDVNELVKSISYNSKDVNVGTIFVCKGTGFKKSYLEDALKRGAKFYVSEVDYAVSIPSIIVKDIRKAMYLIANIYYDNPWNELNIIGITGTKGKSTTLYYIKSILDTYLKRQGKITSGYTSSVDFFDGKNLIEAHNTTPEAMELQKILRNASDNGVEFFEMEVSSQALKYDRVGGMMYDYGIFMNISEDHISPVEHSSYEDYFESKLKLFDITDTAIVNLGSDCIDTILDRAKKAERIITFGMTENADVKGYDIIKSDDQGIAFKVKTKEIDDEFEITMPGLFNVDNALAAIALTLECKIPIDCIKKGLKIAKCPGRMELYKSKDGVITAIVDYAHNKLSFEKIFESVRLEYPGYRVVVIFGSAGEKAISRRKDLGETAGKLVDKIYLTAEDPGEEPVLNTINDIYMHAAKFGKPIERIEERNDAIIKALEDHDEKTVYLVLGKGAENTMKFGKDYVPYPSDIEIVTEYISSYDKNH